MTQSEPLGPRSWLALSASAIAIVCFIRWMLKPKNKYKINGYCHPDYQEVKDEYTRFFRQKMDDNSQLVVYVGQNKVIDLWGERQPHPYCNDNRGEKPYGPDSLVNLYSSGKSVAAILMGMMEDQGRLQYDDKVVKHWPEFGLNGKSEIMISDVLKHQAGLARFDGEVSVDMVQNAALKQNKMGELIEKQSLHYKHGALRNYHAVTKDWITNEIFRRVEPQGRTMGEFFNQEIGLDVYISVPEHKLANCYDFRVWDNHRELTNLMLPDSWGRCSAIGFFESLWMYGGFGRKVHDAGYGDRSVRSGNIDIFWGNNPHYFYNTKAQRTGECPSAGSTASARGLAKLAAIMASGGSFQGKTLMSRQGWERFHSGSEVQVEPLFNNRSIYTQGGVHDFDISKLDLKKDPLKTSEKLFLTRQGFFGWMGIGGSIFQWHPQLKIGFSYVPANICGLDNNFHRAGRLQKMVIDIASKHHVEEFSSISENRALL